MDRGGKGPITRRGENSGGDNRYLLQWAGLSATFNAATPTQTLQHEERLGPCDAQILAQLIPNGVCSPQRSLSHLSGISSMKLSIPPIQRELSAFFFLFL